MRKYRYEGGSSAEIMEDRRTVLFVDEDGDKLKISGFRTYQDACNFLNFGSFEGSDDLDDFCRIFKHPKLKMEQIKE